jgi:hypothetical protein
MKLHILTSLHNYFIMHDNKYFFLNKHNQTILRERGKKNFQGNKLPKTLPKSNIFQNSGGQPLILAIMYLGQSYGWLVDFVFKCFGGFCLEETLAVVG